MRTRRGSRMSCKAKGKRESERERERENQEGRMEEKGEESLFLWAGMGNGGFG